MLETSTNDKTQIITKTYNLDNNFAHMRTTREKETKSTRFSIEIRWAIGIRWILICRLFIKSTNMQTDDVAHCVCKSWEAHRVTRSYSTFDMCFGMCVCHSRVILGSRKWNARCNHVRHILALETRSPLSRTSDFSNVTNSCCSCFSLLNRFEITWKSPLFAFRFIVARFMYNCKSKWMDVVIGVVVAASVIALFCTTWWQCHVSMCDK